MLPYSVFKETISPAGARKCPQDIFLFGVQTGWRSTKTTFNSNVPQSTISSRRHSGSQNSRTTMNRDRSLPEHWVQGSGHAGFRLLLHPAHGTVQSTYAESCVRGGLCEGAVQSDELPEPTFSPKHPVRRDHDRKRNRRGQSESRERGKLSKLVSEF